MTETRSDLMARQTRERADLDLRQARERADLRMREHIAAARAWRRRYRHRTPGTDAARIMRLDRDVTRVR